MTDKLHVIESIQIVFGNNEYPGDDYLLGSTEGSEPYDEIKPFIGKRDWSLLASGVLDLHYGALNFFSEAGLRFFLPAYLIADLNDELQTADPLFTLVHGFSNISIEHQIGEQVFIRRTGRDAFINPKRYGTLTFHDYSRYRLSIFSREEAQAIVLFLEYTRDNDPHGINLDQIEAALTSFWYERAETAPTAETIAAHLLDEDKYLSALTSKIDNGS
jgi:hypothetical protein